MKNKKTYFTISIVIVVLFLLFNRTPPELSQEKAITNQEIQVQATKKNVMYYLDNCALTNTCNTNTQLVTQPLTNIIEETNTQYFILAQSHQCYNRLDNNAVSLVNNLLAELHHQNPLSISTLKVSQHLTLNLIAQRLPHNFTQQLTQRLQVILDLYWQHFDLKLNQAREINLVILPNMEEYQYAIDELDIHAPTSQGLFWPSTNFAFAVFKNKKQLLNTATHEAIHNINHFLVGYMPSWLNEGLAEYWELIDTTEKNNVIQYQFQESLLPLNEWPESIENLIDSENLWQGDVALRQYLYYSAWALNKYLMSSKQGINLLKHILRQESDDVCYPLEATIYSEIFYHKIDLLPIPFEAWYEENLNIN